MNLYDRDDFGKPPPPPYTHSPQGTNPPYRRTDDFRCTEMRRDFDFGRYDGQDGLRVVPGPASSRSSEHHYPATRMYDFMAESAFGSDDSGDFMLNRRGSGRVRDWVCSESPQEVRFDDRTPHQRRSDQRINVNGNAISANGNVTYIHSLGACAGRENERQAKQRPIKSTTERTVERTVRFSSPSPSHMHTVAVADRTGLFHKKRRYVQISPHQSVRELIHDLIGSSKSRRVVLHRLDGLRTTVLSKHDSIDRVLHRVKYLEIVYAEQTVVMRRYH